MTSQILKSAGFTKTQKSRYLENEALFFLQIKKIINYKSSAACFMAENVFFVSLAKTFINILVVKQSTYNAKISGNKIW